MFLPSSSLDDILFPMTAEVWYAQTTQQDYGNMSRTWVFDRTVNCSVISELSNRGFTGELRTKGQDLIYDSNAFFRTKEDLRKKSNGEYVPITAIAITNIKDPAGDYVWINGEKQILIDGPRSTKYEVKTIVPTFNYDHTLRHFRLFISKSQIQKWDQ
jgi:hypothetical protein